MAKIKVLFLAANPLNTPSLRLDEEIRAITEKIRTSEYGKSIDLRSCWAVRTDDLLQELIEFKPHIVHFSGHGESSGQIILQDEDGLPKFVNPTALKFLFQTLKNNIRAVILNSCYSQIQAETIKEVIDCVIGMSEEIEDKTATIFTSSFYRAVSFGESIQIAYEQGKAALLLEGVSENCIPKLHIRNGIDPASIYLQPKVSASSKYVYRIIDWLSKYNLEQLKEKSLNKFKFVVIAILVVLTTTVLYFLNNFLFDIPTWQYISGKGMTLSSLFIHNGRLYIGVAREDPRNHGLYRTDIRRCNSGLSSRLLQRKKRVAKQRKSAKTAVHIRIRTIASQLLPKLRAGNITKPRRTS